VTLPENRGKGAALRRGFAEANADAPRAPGMLAVHYAPGTPLVLAGSDVLTELTATFARQGKSVAALAFSTARPVDPGLTWLAAPRDAARSAAGAA
jgi:hypothetical protein